MVGDAGGVANPNLGVPCPSRHAISPSMMASRAFTALAIPAHSDSKRLYVRTLRETSVAVACSMYARARKPSYFNSKIQSGSSNGVGRSMRRIGAIFGSVVAAPRAGERFGIQLSRYRRTRSQACFAIFVGRDFKLGACPLPSRRAHQQSAAPSRSRSRQGTYIQ